MPQPTLDEENIRLPGALTREVRTECENKGIPLESLVQVLLENWLADNCPDPLEDIEHHKQQKGFLVATRLFLETLPFETTIKVFEDGVIKYLWANDLFRTMVGKDFDQIGQKTNAEVWSHNLDRARTLEALDRSVIENGNVLCHTDTVVHERSVPRERLGIRFPLSFSRSDVKVIGSIGVDFATKEAAENARLNIQLLDGGPPKARSRR